MEKYKYRNYLESRKNYWEISELHYDIIKDFTFDQWFELKRGASLKMAILALVEKKASLLRFCEENNIIVLRDEGAVYYNYQNNREYCIREQEGLA